MAGTPRIKASSVVKDFGQPRKFLRDMRAKASKNYGSRSTTSGRKTAR